MSKKRYYIASAVLLKVAIIFAILSVLMAINSPQPNINGYYDTLGTLYITCMIFMFIFASAALIGSVAVLLTGLLND